MVGKPQRSAAAPRPSATPARPPASDDPSAIARRAQALSDVLRALQSARPARTGSAPPGPRSDFMALASRTLPPRFRNGVDVRRTGFASAFPDAYLEGHSVPACPHGNGGRIFCTACHRRFEGPDGDGSDAEEEESPDGDQEAPLRWAMLSPTVPSPSNLVDSTLGTSSFAESSSDVSSSTSSGRWTLPEPAAGGPSKLGSGSAT
ncbi:hypothetical protein DFJ74DRAFT_640419 [Hyaloraphidium curvatum]|nr:hypothetical protein DFJ74DRAFT_640419 [Hyaloraphidium curvatum]